jgi:hypothetical protein
MAAMSTDHFAELASIGHAPPTQGDELSEKRWPRMTISRELWVKLLY